jgi:uncharacterized protein (TIGR00369 family)
VERSRTFSWSDPATTAQAGRTMAGLDFLRAIMNGDLPLPAIQETLDMRIVEVEEGRVVFRGRPGEHLYNPLGSVHGAYYAALLDSALGCAIHSLLPAGAIYTTLEYKVNMVRAMSADTGDVYCEGTVVHPGRRIATSEARITGPDGKLYAHGTCSCMIFPPEGG